MNPAPRHRDGAPAPVALSLAVMDGLTAGFALLDGDGRVIDSNRAFRAALGEQRDAPALLRSEGSDAAADLGRVLAGRNPALAKIQTASGDAVAHLIALEAGDHRAAALLAIRPAGKVCIAVEGLMQAYGLAPREAEIGQLLAQGHDIRQVAEKLGIAISTARVHLRNIFRKTRATRQAHLVAMLVSALAI